MTAPANQANLFVRHLPRSVDDRELCSLAQQYGTITSCKVHREMRDPRKIGRSKCTGFVCFATHEQAEEARAKMDRSKLRGHLIQVEWATTQHRAALTPKEQQQARKLMVYNVPPSVSTEDVRALVCNCGTVTAVSLCNDFTGADRCIAFITFAEDGHAAEALKLLNWQRPWPALIRGTLVCKLSTTQEPLRAAESPSHLEERHSLARAAFSSPRVNMNGVWRYRHNPYAGLHVQVL